MSGSEVKALNQPTSSQLEIKFDSDLGVFWAYMTPYPRPCFNLHLLDELNGFIETIKKSSGRQTASPVCLRCIGVQDTRSL